MKTGYLNVDYPTAIDVYQNNKTFSFKIDTFVLVDIPIGYTRDYFGIVLRKEGKNFISCVYARAHLLITPQPQDTTYVCIKYKTHTGGLLYIGERIGASDELGQPEAVYEHALLTVGKSGIISQ